LTLSAIRPLEVVMTRFSPLPLLAGSVMALSLAACGGSQPSVAESAADAGVSSAQPDGDGGGLPGGPGADPAEGDDGGGVEAEGNPGAPGDVSVFEERGVSYADFRDGSAQRVCVDEGKCTLAPVNDPDATYSDPEQCPIADMDYSGGTHTGSEGQEMFLEGATVTVTVDCSSLTDPDGNGIPGDQSSDAGDQSGG
jgi:hypothetical protein